MNDASGGKITPTLREADTLLKGILTTLRDIDKLSESISKRKFSAGGSGAGGATSSGAGAPTPSFSGQKSAPTSNGSSSGGSNNSSSNNSTDDNNNNQRSTSAKVVSSFVAVAISGAVSRTETAISVDQQMNHIIGTSASPGRWTKNSASDLYKKIQKDSYGGFTTPQDLAASLSTQQNMGVDLGSAGGQGYNRSLRDLARETGQNAADTAGAGSNFGSAQSINRLRLYGINARDPITGEMKSPQSVMGSILKLETGGHRVSDTALRQGLMPGGGIYNTMSGLGFSPSQIQATAVPYMMGANNPAMKGRGGQGVMG